MRILFFTDSHIRSNAPKNRVDNFSETLEKKFLEIGKIISENNVDFVLHGGDLFDRPDISINTFGKFAQILMSYRVPIWGISGNHDIYGQNPSTVQRTMLGLLDTLNIVKLIHSDSPIFLEKDNIRVKVSGQSYFYDIDNSTDHSPYIVKDDKNDCNFRIHLVHGMLLDKPFFDGIPYTLIDNIKSTNSDITLTGHYHTGFKEFNFDGKYIINPGSLVRLSNTNAELKRQPKIVLIDLNEDIKIEYIYLKSALKGDLVFSKNDGIVDSKKITEYEIFKNSLEMAKSYASVQLVDIVNTVVKNEHMSDEIRSEAIKRLSEAYEEISVS